MTDNEHLVIAGRDITAFVSEWSAMLTSGGGEARGLHDLALDGDEPGYFYGSAFLMRNIAARAMEPTATEEELLLFAVLAVFQDDKFPGVDPDHWDGIEAHLNTAFAHFNELGEKEAARKLRMEVVNRSLREDPPLWKELKNSRPLDPAREALHDQDMASIDQRSFRAARLLDPEGNFDDELRTFSQS
ncbi:hypothetical protein PSET11_02474 [Arthrobacter ulcerisalmonis]|uniref:Uncharacterized protein n=1 Tax=Arthrobacter ulcerisalmonis TaxID=2483813 RepID=A0A3P5X7C8_9MICC|nr:hypothetical protein [Arthrobacter ulcerisalmonis]VDC30314.1 hypothetical protein PSET11_02474 [Arthrobacter ulcerisalmonis]